MLSQLSPLPYMAMLVSVIHTKLLKQNKIIMSIVLIYGGSCIDALSSGLTQVSQIIDLLPQPSIDFSLLSFPFKCLTRRYK